MAAPLRTTTQSISVTYRFHYVTLGHMLNTGPDLQAYRDAVADLLLEIAGYAGQGNMGKAERVLTERIGGTAAHRGAGGHPGGQCTRRRRAAAP